MKRILMSLGLALTMALPAWSADRAGQAVLVVGQAFVQGADGAKRRLRKNDTVQAGDTVSTGRHSYVNLLFDDEGRTLVGPNSAMKLEAFEYQPARHGGPREKGNPASRGEGRSVFSLLKGSLRAITGLIGRNDRSAYSMSTPVATIGIRGTDYFVVYCEDQCEGLGELPEGLVPEGGVVVGVHDGGVAVLNEAQQSFDVDKDNFLLVTATGEFVPLPGPPGFMLMNPLNDPANCQ